MLQGKIWIYSNSKRRKLKQSIGFNAESSEYNWEIGHFCMAQENMERKNKTGLIDSESILKNWKSCGKTASNCSSETTCYETNATEPTPNMPNDIAQPYECVPLPQKSHCSNRRCSAPIKAELSYDTYESAWTSQNLDTGENTWTIVHVSSSLAGDSSDLSSFSLRVVEGKQSLKTPPQPNSIDQKALTSHSAKENNNLKSIEASSQSQTNPSTRQSQTNPSTRPSQTNPSTRQSQTNPSTRQSQTNLSTRQSQTNSTTRPSHSLAKSTTAIPTETTQLDSSMTSYFVAVESAAAIPSPLTVSQQGTNRNLNTIKQKTELAALPMKQPKSKDQNSLSVQISEMLQSTNAVCKTENNGESSKIQGVENSSEFDNFKTMELSPGSAQSEQRNELEEDGTQTSAVRVIQHSAQTSFQITVDSERANASQQTSHVVGITLTEPQLFNKSRAGKCDANNNLESRQENPSHEAKTLQNKSLVNVLSVENPADMTPVKKRNTHPPVIAQASASINTISPNVFLHNGNIQCCAEAEPCFKNFSQKKSEKSQLSPRIVSQNPSHIHSSINSLNVTYGGVQLPQSMEGSFSVTNELNSEVAANPNTALEEVQYSITADVSLRSAKPPSSHIALVTSSELPNRPPSTTPVVASLTKLTSQNSNPQVTFEKAPLKTNFNAIPGELQSSNSNMISNEAIHLPMPSLTLLENRPKSNITNQSDHNHNIFPGALAALQPCFCHLERQNEVVYSPPICAQLQQHALSNDDSSSRDRESHLQKKNISFMKINRRQRNLAPASTRIQNPNQSNRACYEFKHSHWDNDEEVLGLSVTHTKKKKNVMIGRSARAADMISLSAGVSCQAEGVLNPRSDVFRMPAMTESSQANNVYALTGYDQNESIESNQNPSAFGIKSTSPNFSLKSVKKTSSFRVCPVIRQAQPQVASPQQCEKQKQQKRSLKKRICEEFVNKLQIHEAGETYCRAKVELCETDARLAESYLSEDTISMTSSDIVKYWVKNSPILPNYYNSHRLKESASTSTEAVRSTVSRISLRSDEESSRFNLIEETSTAMYPSAG